MRAAYVDTSCLVAIAFAQREAGHMAKRLEQFEQRFSSNLLEAELRAALVREGAAGDPAPLLSRITWIHPNRALTREFEAITARGYLKGADLWHLACALFLAHEPKELSFLTLDKRQKDLASRLGFPT